VVDGKSYQKVESNFMHGESLYRILAQNLPDTAVILFDRDMRYLMAEGKILAEAGYVKEELVGKTAFETVSRESLDVTLPRYRAALKGEESTFEHSRNGRYYLTHIVPIKDDDGNISAGMIVLQNITQRKQSEIALRESEERFRQFVENIGSVFWMISPDTQEMIYVSPAYETIWGRPCQEMYENPLSFVKAIHPDDREKVLQERTEKLLKGLYNVEYRIIRPDGETRWIASRAYPIQNRQGEIYRIVGISEDITPRKEMEKQTFDITLEREYGRVLADFVRDTSHDLRTPLSIIHTSLYLLRKIDDPQKRIERLDTLEEQANHLDRLINDLQTMANMDISANLEKTEVNINQLVQDVINWYSNRSAEHGHRIVWNPRDHFLPIQADEGELSHAFTNLLDNAILYTPDNGIITIETTQNGHETIISVSDNGIGIQQRHLEHIFERFYKVDAARPTGKSGPGLGLTMAKKIVEMHGGHIEVESIPGVGSTFRICLARLADE
jgi:PAS domain S-box-containing protein